MKKANILLVDDDEIYLYLTKRLLNDISEEIAVSSFTDGEQAIDFIKVCTEAKAALPDIILLDVNMPFLDGWGFLKEFKKLKPRLEDKILIYLVTSSELEKDKKYAQDFEELTGYYVKPISEDNLLEILTDVYKQNW